MYTKLSAWFPTSLSKKIFKVAALVHVFAFLLFESFDLILDHFIPIAHEDWILWFLQNIMFFSLLLISSVICIEGAKILLHKNQFLYIKNKYLREAVIVLISIGFFIISFIDDELESKLLNIGKFFAKRSPLSVDIILFGIISYKLITGIIGTLFRAKKELTPHMVLEKIKEHVIQFTIKIIGILVLIKLLLHGAGHHKLAYTIIQAIYHILTSSIVSLSISGIGFGIITLFTLYTQRRKKS